MPSDGGTSPASTALPPWIGVAAVFGGVLLLAILAVLTLTLFQLHDSGGHIESQDKKVAAIFRAGRPLVARTSDVADDLAPAVRAARRLAAPLIASRSGADLALALQRFPLLDASVRRLVADAVPLLDAVDPAVLNSTVESAGDLAGALGEGNRLVGTVDAAAAALSELGDRDLIARTARSVTRLRKLLAVQRRTRALQRRALEVQRRSLAIQRRTLGHVRNLDRKTGGELVVRP